MCLKPHYMLLDAQSQRRRIHHIRRSLNLHTEKKIREIEIGSSFYTVELIYHYYFIGKSWAQIKYMLCKKAAIKPSRQLQTPVDNVAPNRDGARKNLQLGLEIW